MEKKIQNFRVTIIEDGVTTEKITYGKWAADQLYCMYTSGATARGDKGVTVLMEKIMTTFLQTATLEKVFQS